MSFSVFLSSLISRITNRKKQPDEMSTFAQDIARLYVCYACDLSLTLASASILLISNFERNVNTFMAFHVEFIKVKYSNRCACEIVENGRKIEREREKAGKC